MKTASLDLCRQLYELNGWRGTEHIEFAETNRDTEAGDVPEEQMVPLYDLSYLLDKLPGALLGFGLILSKGGYEQTYDFKIGYGQPVVGDDLIHWSKFRVEVDEPETAVDAACALALDLFKPGVLKPSPPVAGARS